MLNEDQITELENEIKGKKLLLKALKAEKKREVPFVKTKFGRAYLKTVEFVTRPLGHLHMNAQYALEDPDRFVSDRHLKRAGDLLEQAKDSEVPNHELSNKMAYHLLKMEKHYSGVTPTSDLFPFVELREEIERLRPEESKQKAEEIKAVVDNHLSAVNSHCMLPNNIDNVPVKE
jgi:hypothetical protein